MNTLNTKDINVVLMHGKDTDPTKKWYTWLKIEMQMNNIEFKAPFLPEADDPNIKDWLFELEKTSPTENSILVGHSRGGVAILRWLEKQPDNFKVRKVILIGTNSGHSEKMSRTENNKGFYTKNGFDFQKIRNHCNKFTILHSRDDEWVPFSAGEENSKGLNAKFLKFENKGHFGSKLPKQEISELLDEILQEIK